MRQHGAISLVSDVLRSFQYDAQNRLAKVQLTQAPEAAKISYLHNALGQRVFKSEPQVAQTAPNASTLGTPFVNWLQTNFGWLLAQAQANATLGQSYVYDDGQLGSTPLLVGEYGNGSSQTLGRSEYLWLPQEDGSTMPIGLYTNNRIYAIQADHLNTPRQITDDANKVAWQLPYSAFGDNKPTGVLAQAGTLRLKATVPGVTFNLRFPGQYFDQERNLNYNYFRSYQPSQGRYPQPDPIGLAGGSNRFSYVDGNPLSMTDSMGLVASNDPWFGYGGDKGFKDWWQGQKPYYGGQDIPNKEVCDNLYKDYKESNERGKGGKSGRGGKSKSDKRPNVNELIRNGGRGGYGRGGSEE